METLGADDWMMAAAWLFYMVDVGTGMGMMKTHFGLHTYQLTTKQMENNLMVSPERPGIVLDAKYSVLLHL